MKIFSPLAYTDSKGTPLPTHTEKCITSNFESLETEVMTKIVDEYLGIFPYYGNEYTFHFKTESASIYFLRKILY